MSFKNRQLGRSLNLRDGSPLLTPGTSMGVDFSLLTPQKARINMPAAGAALEVTAALDYGSLLLATFPDRNIMLLSAETNLTLVKAGTVNGLITTTDLNVALGTVAASNITLTSTMIDVVEVNALTTDALSVALAVHNAGQATATMPKMLLDSATNTLYLNVAVALGITADDTLNVTGYVDVYFIDLGNATS